MMDKQSNPMEPVVACPQCGHRFLLSKALVGPIETQVAQRLEREYEQRAHQHDTEMRERMAEAIAQATQKAKVDQALEVKALRQEVAEKEEAITALHEAELSVRKRARALADREKALELDVERRLEKRAESIEKETARRIEEQHHLKDAEKDKQLADVRRQLEEASRKAQQGSQQIQGEVAEQELETQLLQAFPLDQFEAVSTGQRGADVIQRVVDQRGHVCGSIIWERKNAKNFSETWIPKLREDQRANHAEIAVLVPAVLPGDVRVFGQHGGVWVVGASAVVSLGTALRSGLLSVAQARVVAEGHAGKQAALMGYVTGTEFRQRVEAVLDPVKAMMEDIQKERRALETSLARREKRHEQIVRGIAGLWGDVSGLMGTLPTPKHLQLPTGGEGDQEAAF